MAVRLDFDANATTALHPEVRERLRATWSDPSLDANPASAHQAGQRARSLLESARRRLAAAFDADPLNVVWTSGGSEANTSALTGVSWARRKAQLAEAIAYSPMEHPCVLETIAALQAHNFEAQPLSVDPQGRIEVQNLHAYPEGTLGLLSCMLASHELGNLYPVAELGAMAKARHPGLWLHCDAVQAVGKCPLSFSALGVDSLALSAHKFGGPKGVGALLLRRGAQMESLIRGGSQERGFRGGTPSPRLADAMALAAELAQAERLEKQRHCLGIYDFLRSELAALPEITLLGDPEQHLGTTLCLMAFGLRGQDLMIALDLDGVEVSTGAACSVGSTKASASIMALGHSAQAAQSVLRISWSAERSLQDAQRLVKSLREVLQRLRKVSGGLS